MDRKHAVEVFRNMLNEYDLVSHDESVLASFLISDSGAVEYFADTYLDCESNKVRERIVHFSFIERNDQFHSDLALLTLWGQYLTNLLLAGGAEPVINAITQFGFNGFRRLSSEDIVRLMVRSRSKATREYCGLRQRLSTSISQTKDVGRLLKKQVTH